MKPGRVVTYGACYCLTGTHWYAGPWRDSHAEARRDTRKHVVTRTFEQGGADV